MSQRPTLALRGSFPAQTEDIQRGIHVSVSREPAMRTSMYPNRQVFQHHLLATVASLRGLVGIDREDCDPGLDSLVVQYLAEHSQRDVVGSTGQIPVFEHKRQCQIFKCNQAISGDQPKNHLMPPITA